MENIIKSNKAIWRILEKLPIGIIFTDLNGKIENANITSIENILNGKLSNFQHLN